MSRVPMGSSIGAQAASTRPGPACTPSSTTCPPNQGIGAEMMVERWGLTRTQLDEYSLASHAKAAAAIDEGRFAGQITPVKLEDGTVIDTDEGVRRGGTLESMAKLKPAFKPDGTIHAGNSSQISDGSAALLMMTSEKARRARPDPARPGAHRRPRRERPGDHAHRPDSRDQEGSARRSGLTVDEIGVFEVNEAFAPVPLAWLAEIGADPAKLNPNGGAIALGHPLGGSGARIMTTMLHHMIDNGLRYGLQTMCEGGGQANATILELL